MEGDAEHEREAQREADGGVPTHLQLHLTGPGGMCQPVLRRLEMQHGPLLLQVCKKETEPISPIKQSYLTHTTALYDP